MRYSPEELKFYRNIEIAITPYLVIFMILFVSPLFIGTILSFIDIYLHTSFSQLVEKMFFDNNQPLLIFVIPSFFIYGIGIFLILTTKYFGNLFAKLKLELYESIKNIENINIIEIKMSRIEKTIKRFFS